MKTTLRSAGLSLIAALFLFFSTASYANVQCADLFQPEKVNRAGETIEELTDTVPNVLGFSNLVLDRHS